MPSSVAVAGTRIPRVFALTIAFVLAVLAGEAGAARPADAPALEPDAFRDGGLYLPSDDGRTVRPAPLLETRIDAAVSGLIARTTVRHRFENPDRQWVEGIYVFPLPQGAAVDTLRMVVGERIIEGRIEERAQAKRTYDVAKNQGQRASLVEQERPNVFTASIANIGPGEEISVEIGFQETLRYDDGRFAYRMPLVVGPRFIPGNRPVAGLAGTGWAVNTDAVPDAARITPPVRTTDAGPGNRVSLRLALDPGFAVAALESPTHAITTETDEAGRTVVTLGPGPHRANRDFTLTWRPEDGAEPTAGLFTETVADEAFALVMLMPPEAPVPDAVLPRDVVFIIDTSGSMHGLSIEQASDALHLALDRLRPQDRFNIIAFASRPIPLFGTSRPAAAGPLHDAHRFVDSLGADGGTNLLPALRLALDGRRDPRRIRQVVLLTDGAVGNERELFAHIVASLGDSRLFTVGIGSAPNGHFMSGAARAGRGTHTYIADVAEVGERMDALLRKLERPMLTDVRIVWPDGTESWPDPVPDLYAGEPVVVAARLPALAGRVSVGGRLGDGAWSAEVALAGGRESPGVGRLWAREKIAALDASRNQGADAEAVRARVLETALAHGLVSRLTSLVAVDATPARPDDAPLDTRPVPTEMPLGWSRRHVFGEGWQEAAAKRPVVLTSADALIGLPRTATPAPLQMAMGSALLAVGLVLVMVARRRRTV
jgi:Ca-activated chloride channel family protein